MKKEVADKWVAALRSGQYRQTNRQLRKRVFNEKGQAVESYCCLGVLCDISGLGYWTGSENCYTHDTFHGSEVNLPDFVRDWAGMLDKDGGFRDGLPTDLQPPAIQMQMENFCLVGINDGWRWDFNKIADLIEKHWEQL